MHRVNLRSLDGLSISILISVVERENLDNLGWPHKHKIFNTEDKKIINDINLYHQVLINKISSIGIVC